MPNARNIKPAALTDHRFYKKDPLLFLLYYDALPMIADREGRLEDELQAIQLKAMPLYPDCNLNDLLCQLESMKAIDRYQIGQIKVIQLNGWHELQRPASLERDGNLPDKNGMVKVWKRNKKHIVPGDFTMTPYGTEVNHVDIGYEDDAFPSDTLTSKNGLPNTDTGLQTHLDNAGTPVDKLKAAVCRLFLANRIQYFKADDPTFNYLLSEVNDLSYWKAGVEIAVRQKTGHSSVNYVMGIVKNKWMQSGESSNGNVYSFNESPEHNTEKDLRRRAAILGIVQGDDNIPNFRIRIESMEKLNVAEDGKAQKIC